MALSFQQVATAKDCYITGENISQTNGSSSMAIPAGTTTTVALNFGLPRTTTVNKGDRLDGLAFTYQLSSGTLASITAALTRIVHTDDAPVVTTNIPLNAASPAFTLTAAAAYNRSVTAVTTPAFDNQATTSDVSYSYVLTIVSTSACVMAVHGIEVLYTSDDASASATFTDIVMTANVPTTISHATDSAGDDLTISLTGATDSSIILSSTGTGTDALSFIASAGSINFNTAGQTFLDGATFKAATISGATVLTNADSGTFYAVQQTSAYAITLPTPPSVGTNYRFVIETAGAFNITISNGSAHLIGTIVNDVTSVIPATGATLTFASGAAAVGDSIEIVAITATRYAVRAFTSTAGGITIA